MIRKLQEDLIQIKGRLVTCYLLIEEESRACLIDGGFWGDFQQIERALRSEGLGLESIQAVLMTHGHLDHTYNVGKVLKHCNARVYGHASDQLHFQGEYAYQGLSRVCGWLEFLGRKISGYSPVTISHTIKDGDELDIWGGLRVIHTPGHTKGHCSFYSLKHKLLFSGDLFASWRSLTMLPWPWLNSCPSEFPQSIRKILELSPEGMLSNHCDGAHASEQRERFFHQFSGRYG